MRKTRKFMLSIDNGPPWRLLKREAKQRGLKVQDMIRAVVVPEWFRDQAELPPFVRKFTLGLVQGIAQGLGTNLITSVLKGNRRAQARSESQSNSNPSRPTRSHTGSPLTPVRGKSS